MPPNLSSLSGFEQPPMFNIVLCSQLNTILPKKAVLKSKTRAVKLYVDHSHSEIPSHPRNVRSSSFAFESLKPNRENFLRMRKKHHQSFKSDKQAQLFHSTLQLPDTNMHHMQRFCCIWMFWCHIPFSSLVITDK